jgi:integrase
LTKDRRRHWRRWKDVDQFLECVLPFYRPFFVVAFFTGMSAGEMSALKWKDVDFDRRIIKVVELVIPPMAGQMDVFRQPGRDR